MIGSFPGPEGVEDHDPAGLVPVRRQELECQVEPFSLEPGQAVSEEGDHLRGRTVGERLRKVSCRGSTQSRVPVMKAGETLQ